MITLYDAFQVLLVHFQMI